MLWSLVGLFSIFSGVLFGALSDRIGRREGLMVVFAVQTGAYLLAGAGSGVGVLFCSIVLYGLSAFAIPTIMAAAVGDYLGIGRAPAAFALVTFFFAFGQTLGPATAGILAEAMGSFSVSYLAAAAMTGLAVGMSAFLPPVRQDS
jgi:MFS family permease